MVDRLRTFLIVLLAGLAAGIGMFLLEPTRRLPALAQTSPSRPPTVYLLTFEGAVTPILERYLATALVEAQTAEAEAIILRLDTPGGNVEVTKSITQEMLASPLPIVVYVAPTGARAGSAGTFITLAGHVAAMAPGTSIGAASPVGSGGEEIGETMEAKVKNILSADIENLAERRGEEATEWAVSAVQEAAAATARQALDLGVIDFVAADVSDLLDQMDGFEVTVRGEPYVMNTAGATVEEIELSAIERFLNFITDPSIAAILLSLGVLGLVVEIRTPGFGLPGIVGAVSLLLAFYALGQLDANFAGLALIAVALILFVAEAFTPTFGALALGGVIAFVLGAALLFDTATMPIPWVTIIVLAVLLGGFAIFAGSKALAAQRRPIEAGGEALIGQRARAGGDFTSGQTGSVFVMGEWWNARSTGGDISQGQEAEIVGRDGYTLLVRAVDGRGPSSTADQGKSKTGNG